MARWCIILFVSAAAAQVQLEFAPPYNYSRVVQLSNGNRLLIGSYSAASSLGLNASGQRLHLALETLAPSAGQNGELLPQPQPGGSGNDVPEAVAIDATGNIWIAGETDSDDFTLVNPIVSQKVPYRTAGFVMEIDPTGSKLLFATYLCGQAPSFGVQYYATHATAITVDAAGNAYVGGNTDERDFPTTSGAFLSGKGGADTFGNTSFYSFLMKISPTGKLIYSTELATGSAYCSGGSACIAEDSTSATVSSLAVDSTGAVTLAGLMGGSYNPGSGYVTKAAPDGSKLVWSVGVPFSGATISVFLAQDTAGNVNLFGEYATLATQHIQPYTIAAQSGLFTARLGPDGSTIRTADLGLSPDAHAAGILLDSSGNVYVAGASSSPQFPSLGGVPNLGPDFLMLLDSSGSKAQRLWRFPSGAVSAPPVLAADGRIMLPGAYGALLSLPPTYAFDSPAIVGFANSASFELNTGLFPGALVSLFGFDLAASGIQVQFGGVPAPLLYTSATQVNLQVPFELSPYGAPLQVSLPAGNLLQPVTFSQAIGIFTTDGVHAAALNQDGSVNSASNPAAAGSIVSLFGTGADWQLLGLRDGAVATAPLQLFQFQAFGGSFPLPIQYAGAAPGLLDGVFQINLEIPTGYVVPYTIQTTSAFGVPISSNLVQVYSK
jgi:uncharacterized protein (TIGR03437 family)